MAARGADLGEAWFDPGNGESAGQCPVSPFAEPKTLHPGDMPRRVTLTDYKGLACWAALTHRQCSALANWIWRAGLTTRA